MALFAPQRFERPILVSLIAILNIVGGVAFILFDVFFGFQFGQMAQKFGVSPIEFVLNLLFLGGLAIVSGLGMWKGTEWGWWYSNYFFVHSILRNINAIILIVFFSSELGSSRQSLEFMYFKFSVRAIMSAIILYYLFRPKIREYFGTVDVTIAETAKKMGVFAAAVIFLTAFHQIVFRS